MRLTIKDCVVVDRDEFRDDHLTRSGLFHKSIGFPIPFG